MYLREANKDFFLNDHSRCGLGQNDGLWCTVAIMLPPLCFSYCYSCVDGAYFMTSAMGG